MTLQHLVDSYGYIAILIGTVLEGETILVLGGIASKLGYLELPWVMLYAFVGSLFGDQFYFFLGRFKGQAMLRKRPAWQKRAEKIHRIMERHRIPIIIGFRFLYGLRLVTPFAIGMSRVPIIEFVILNTIGAAVWAVVIGSLGYAFGHGLELILGDLRHYELEVLGAVLAAGVLTWIFHFTCIRRQQKRTGARD